MTFSALQKYANGILTHIPWPHWVVLGMLSLALTIYLLIRKRYSLYSTICLGIATFIGLFLLDAAVLNRMNSIVHPTICFSLPAEYHRLIHGGSVRWTEMLANIAVFVPFGFFLSEFLSATKCLTCRRRLGLVVVYTFVFSLCIECLQLTLRLGVCEVTDLVLNTAGAFIGASLALLFRILLGYARNDK